MARSFFTWMTLTKNQNSDQYTREVVEWLENWMRTNTFSRYRKSKTVVENYTLGVKDLSTLLRVSEKTAKEARLLVSKELFQIFGEDFFTVLSEKSENSRKEIQNRLNFVESSYGIENIRTDVVLKVKTQGKEKGTKERIRVEDCAREILFLKRNTVHSLHDELNDLDLVKLNYLLEMLEGTAGEHKDKLALVNFLRGEIS